MNTTELDEIAKEADEWHSKLEGLYKTDDNVNKLYRGIDIWFSPIIERPEIMFLGINQGVGYYKNNNNTLVHRIQPREKPEYVDDEVFYILKRDWEYVFRDKENCLNRRDLLEKSVKSNFCYFATENTKSMEKLFTQMSCKFGISPYKLCGDWTYRMIKSINPKILICEGKKAFDLLCRWSFPDEFIKYEITQSVKRGHIDSIKVIQVTRFFSTLRDAGEIVKQIQKSL